jgi:two-component system nitrogen regulation response regulator GlnG
MVQQYQPIANSATWNGSHPAKNPEARVLVVDDERLLRWAIAETLTAHGYVVAEAGDAQSALNALGGRTAPDLVLLDLFLPDACNLRLLELIRTAVPAVPVILMSACATPDIVDQALAMGARVIPKPFDMDMLAALIDRTVAKRQQ